VSTRDAHDIASFCALLEVRERLEIADDPGGGFVWLLPKVCAQDGGAVLRALPQTAAIDTEEHHHAPETVANPLVELVQLGGGARRDDLAHERLEAKTFGQRFLGLATAATLNEQRDDECRLQSDEPRDAHDMPAVLLPEGWLPEDDLAVLG